MSLKKGLGKGLGALIEPEKVNSESKSGIINLDINKIEPNKLQPRKYFNETSLKELADSIKQFGIIQPLIVKDEGEYYSIIAGERRWRAARIAEVMEIPVIIKEYNAAETLQIALIENIQRQDLNPIEEAQCYKRLSEDYFFTQDDIATKIGKSRNSVSYILGLLNLNSKVQNFVAEGKLNISQARSLLAVKDGDAQFTLAEQIIENELSSRNADTIIKAYLDLESNIEEEQEENHKAKVDRSSYESLEKKLKVLFGTKVLIKNGKNKGKIEIEYYSDGELDRLLGLFVKIGDDAK